MKHFSALISATVILIALVSPGAALDTKFYTVTEKTLSIDLGPSFIIEQGKFDANEDGMITQEFLINNTGAPGSALVSITGVYDNELRYLSPSNLSQIFASGVILGMEERGDRVAGNWTAQDSRGGNVTVQSLISQNPENASDSRAYDMAVWNLEGPNYAIVISLLDSDNTTRLINTMTLT